MAFQATAFQHGLLTPGFQVIILPGGTGADRRSRKPEEKKRSIPASMRPSALFKPVTRPAPSEVVVTLPPRPVMDRGQAEVLGGEVLGMIRRRDEEDAAKALAAMAQKAGESAARSSAEESEAEAAIATMLLFDDE